MTSESIFKVQKETGKKSFELEAHRGVNDGVLMGFWYAEYRSRPSDSISTSKCSGELRGEGEWGVLREKSLSS